jgi:hypothetical protein
MDISVHLFKNKDKQINQLKYSLIIKSLVYFMNYWKTIKRVFKYFTYTLDYELHYTSYSMTLERCNEANWISNNNDSKYTSGYIFILGRTTVL